MNTALLRSPRIPLSRTGWRRLLLGLTLITLAGLLAVRQTAAPPQVAFESLPEPPAMPLAPGIGLGDRNAGGWLMTLWLQGFDSQAAGEIQLKALDYDRLAQWLLKLDEARPGAVYPMKLTVATYAAVLDPARQRRMYRLARELFARAPETRWYWMAMATAMAWHKLQDRPLARTMADDLYRLAPLSAPDWARLMKVYLHRTHDEVETAILLAREALRSGRFRDAREREELITFIETLKRQREQHAASSQEEAS